MQEPEQQAGGSADTSDRTHAQADAAEVILCIEQALHIEQPDGLQHLDSSQAPAAAVTTVPGSSSQKVQAPATAEAAGAGCGSSAYVRVWYEWGQASGATPAAPLSGAGSASWQHAVVTTSPRGSELTADSLLRLQVATPTCCALQSGRADCAVVCREQQFAGVDACVCACHHK